MTINFELLKVSKIIGLKISSHGEARNIKFGQRSKEAQGLSQHITFHNSQYI